MGKRFCRFPASKGDMQVEKDVLIGVADLCLPDSRVDQALVLRLELGEAFTLRSIETLLPAHSGKNGFGSAGSAIEYAMLDLTVKNRSLNNPLNCPV
ncbi:hypothetical protein KP509_08G069100 [Ceratopteris richardii]|uniref:Carbonic anhydrase n=1 Tax=Ceratopteris richardii TaxID=49495 RepID=A0A8T2UHD9_CERRI|nr:hypothetical protein KP509_08G069100 [Ceratopteris richardii]